MAHTGKDEHNKTDSSHDENWKGSCKMLLFTSNQRRNYLYQGGGKCDLCCKFGKIFGSSYKTAILYLILQCQQKQSIAVCTDSYCLNYSLFKMFNLCKRENGWPNVAYFVSKGWVLGMGFFTVNAKYL